MGAELQAFPSRPPPQIKQPKRCTWEMPVGRSLEKKVHQYLGTFNTYLTLCGALGPVPSPTGPGLWRGLSSRARRPGAGHHRAGLTFQMAHVSPHPLLLLLVPNLGVEPLFQAPQGPFCFPQTPFQVHTDLHLSLREEERREKWGPGKQLPPTLEAFPDCPGLKWAFSPLDMELPPSPRLMPSTRWPALGPAPSNDAP